MVEGHAGANACVVTTPDYTFVVVEHRCGEYAFDRFDSRPLDRKPVTIQSKRLEQIYVVRVAVQTVASVAGALFEYSWFNVFHDPGVGVDVVALDLMASSRGAPQE